MSYEGGDAALGRRWEAVLARDAGSDGAFVFAVTTTGIYCRPSCPAKRPLQRNVRLFRAPEGAEKAGFRPCRRCRPRDGEGGLAAIAAVCRAIDAREGERVGLDALARSAGVSPGHLRRLFKQALGVTPRAFADARRLRALRARLRKGHMVTDSLYEVGYGSSSRLYEASPGRLGMTPGAYRKGGEGMRLSYGFGTSPLGRVLVATTERGIAAVSMGEKDEALLKDLEAEFPKAEIQKDKGAVARALELVLGRLGGGGARERLPLDIQATAFERAVWDALLKIPRGATRSYGEVAREVGSGPRAVAKACARNRIAVLVPCHRVVGGDGELRGYRWGVARKRALLTAEGALPPEKVRR
jgi:AraC family transcriptional regulator of adaptative response/methylated-DNA-[protein]-cysteine methyltransferase